ncbi:MAG: hypothetical protein V1754_01060, partial [Pseudomonadota bacterium]
MMKSIRTSWWVLILFIFTFVGCKRDQPQPSGPIVYSPFSGKSDKVKEEEAEEEAEEEGSASDDEQETESEDKEEVESETDFDDEGDDKDAGRRVDGGNKAKGAIIEPDSGNEEALKEAARLATEKAIDKAVRSVNVQLKQCHDRAGASAGETSIRLDVHRTGYVTGVEVSG